MISKEIVIFDKKMQILFRNLQSKRIKIYFRRFGKKQKE